MVGIADTPDSNFEQAYLEVRNLMEKHDHWLIQLQLTDDYLGAAAEDVHFREEPIWEGFVPEPGVQYMMGPPTDWETVSVAVEERVISFSECNKSWLTTETVVQLLDDERPGNIQDPSMFTLIPAAKTIEMHWRRLFLHPDDFHSRHFSIPRAMNVIRSKYINMNEESTTCYESGIDPHPQVCPDGPVWGHFKSAIVGKPGIEALQELFDLTRRIWFPSHEYRHSKISEWHEIKPIYTQLSLQMDDLFSLLKNLLGPKWA